jgi:transcription factor TFIIIB component B''
MEEENKVDCKINSYSFKNKAQTSKWTTRETRKFYKLLEIFGTDFSMIESAFQTRTREEIKKKFQKEERE